jgi:hypothetical protein
MELKAYRINGVTELPIVPAPERRDWHKEIPGIGACLPLTIANGGGWWLLNPQDVYVDRIDTYNYNVRVRKVLSEHEEPTHVASHFGFGVLTVLIPYVFRTPPGWELLIRGPSNVFYEGLHAFEGIVESDWHSATATMNWMVERDTQITIRRGEPLVQVVPIKTEALEQFQPEILDMPEDVEQEFMQFAEKRMEQITAEGKMKYSGEYPRNERTRRRHLKLRPL